MEEIKKDRYPYLECNRVKVYCQGGQNFLGSLVLRHQHSKLIGIPEERLVGYGSDHPQQDLGWREAGLSERPVPGVQLIQDDAEGVHVPLLRARHSAQRVHLVRPEQLRGAVQQR